MAWRMLMVKAGGRYWAFGGMLSVLMALSVPLHAQDFSGEIQAVEEVASQEAVPTEAIQNYYQQGGESSEMMAEEASPSSSVPIPASWTNSFFDPQPHVEFRAEALWFQPNFDDSPALARQTQPTPDNSGFQVVPVGVSGNTENVITPQAFAEYHWNEQGSFELGGFYMDGPQQGPYPLSNEDQTLFFNGNAPALNQRGFVINAPPTFPLVATDASLDTSFRTWSVEASLWHHFICMKGHISDLAIGFGGRYLSVDENVNLTIVNELDRRNARMNVASGNDIFGPQILFKGRVNGPGKRIRLLTIGKIGLMANNSTNTNTLLTATTGLISRNNDNEILFTPLFEGLFAFEFYIWHNVSIYGGYQLLYMDRVDRAGGHFTGDIAAFQRAGKQLGDVFLYGPRVGLLASF